MAIELIGMIGVRPEGADGAAVHVIGGVVDLGWVRDLIPGERLGDLPGNPFRGGMGRDAEGEKAPTIVPQDDQDIEHPEADGGNDQEVDGRDSGCVVAEKSAPTLRRRPPASFHVLGHRRLTDFDFELEQLAMDAGRPPQRVGQAHVPDETPNICRNPRTATARPGSPAPIEPKAAPVPAHQRLRPNHRHDVHDARIHPVQPNEDQPIEVGEPRPSRRRALEDTWLVPEDDVLDLEPCPQLERRHHKVFKEP